MELQDIKSMTLAEIQESFTNDKLPKFRALQVYQWLHRGAESFDEMSNVSNHNSQPLPKVLCFYCQPYTVKTQALFYLFLHSQTWFCILHSHL